MEKQYGAEGVIPHLVLKQEKLFDKTMMKIQNFSILKIQNFSILIGSTMNEFGNNLLKSSGHDFNRIYN